MSSQIEEVKSRTDVADLISSYFKLQRAGVNFKARCPFHNEKSASFFVSPARQIWHCFGCQKGGDVFKFIMEIEGCEFREALENLANRAGVELKKEAPGVKNEREKTFVIMEEAAKFFEEHLANEALVYLKNRGLTEETIKEFRLGYAKEEWRSLLQHLVLRGFKEVDIEKCGLVIKKEDGGYYDRFRGRIMFPIFNISGKVIAFGGRILEAPIDGREPSTRSVGAKYVNSPETILYQKSKVLYGLHKSKIEILRQDSCIVVEGYMDFLSVYQAGTKNVVATSGTAFGEYQLRILRRMTEKIVAAFDMDEAGENAARRGIELALKEGFEIRILKFGEEFKDPADVLKKDNNLWLKYLQQSRHIVQFYIDSALKKYASASSELSREVQKSVLPAVASLSSELEVAHWIRELSSILNIKEEAIWDALSRIKNLKHEIINNDEKIINAPKSQTRKELLENRVLGMAAKYPDFLKKTIHLEPNFFSGDKQTAFAEIKNGSSSFKDFISRLVLESELFLEGIADAEAEFKKCVHELQKEHTKEKMNILSQKIILAEKNNSAELDQLLLEFKNLSNQMRHL
ncbi:MAG: DNA primase [Patescibacteria group bacterium]